MTVLSLSKDCTMESSSNYNLRTIKVVMSFTLSSKCHLSLFTQRKKVEIETFNNKGPNLLFSSRHEIKPDGECDSECSVSSRHT